MLGRFIQADTIVPDPTNPQSLNRYSYVRNSPLNYTDPTGHMEVNEEHTYHEGVSDYWHPYVNPDASGCQVPTEEIDQAMSTGIDFTPGLGDLKGFAEVFTGKDLITGESLGAWRWLGLLGLSELKRLKYADEAVDIIDNAVSPVRSLIKDNSRLVKEAERAGRSDIIQETLDKLVRNLSAGNMNPGIGNRHLFNGVFEARAKNGARVYFRNAVDGVIEILAKSDKNNQGTVIRTLRRIYGD